MLVPMSEGENPTPKKKRTLTDEDVVIQRKHGARPITSTVRGGSIAATPDDPHDKPAGGAPPTDADQH